MTDFFYDSTTGTFTDDTGATVTIREIREAIQFTIDGIVEGEVLPLVQALQNSEISSADFSIAMSDLIKQTQTMAGSVALGGWQNVTPSQWGKIGSYVKQQYGFFDDFVREIESGLTLDGRFVNRSVMYIQDALTTFENSRRFADYADLERRLLDPTAQNCDDCIDYAAEGWVPLGTLPDIGDECQCLSNCRCMFDFASTGGDEGE